MADGRGQNKMGRSERSGFSCARQIGPAELSLWARSSRLMGGAEVRMEWFGQPEAGREWKGLPRGERG